MNAILLTLLLRLSLKNTVLWLRWQCIPFGPRFRRWVIVYDQSFDSVNEIFNCKMKFPEQYCAPFVSKLPMSIDWHIFGFLSYHCIVASPFFNKCVGYSTMSYISVLVTMIWSLQDIQLVRFWTCMQYSAKSGQLCITPSVVRYLVSWVLLSQLHDNSVSCALLGQLHITQSVVRYLVSCVLLRQLCVTWSTV